MTRPLVSALITNYNYSEFLEQCINGVLQQSYGNVQVVVVDDGSTDESLQVLRRFGRDVEVIEQPNRGQAAAFATGALHCRGELICLLDADDLWYPDKIARIVEVFAAHPNVSWLRHKLQIWRVDGNEPGAALPRFRGSCMERADPNAIVERLIMAPTSSLVLRKTIAGRVLVADTLRWDADAMVLARAVQLGASGYSLDAVLGRYRLHGGQQFVSRADIQSMLERQIDVGTRIAKFFGEPPPVSTYKHQLIVQFLTDTPACHPRRAATALKGLYRARKLVRRPGIAARQVSSLLYAAIAPATWIKRFRMRGGYQ